MQLRKISKLTTLLFAFMVMPVFLNGADDSTMTEADKHTQEWHKRFAVQFNNRTWSLLAKDSRIDEENEEMIHAAHASYYHWSRIGEPVNLQRGEWLISHVYAVLKQSDLAIHHASKCLALTEEHKFMDFDLAYAYEAMARAHAAGGYDTEAKRYLNMARKAGDKIKREEDRKLFLTDLETGPWFGIK